MEPDERSLIGYPLAGMTPAIRRLYGGLPGPAVPANHRDGQAPDGHEPDGHEPPAQRRRPSRPHRQCERSPP